MAITLDSFLNFIIPYFVWAFLLWILYRVPIIKQGVDALFKKISEWRENKEESYEDNFVKSITYE